MFLESIWCSKLDLNSCSLFCLWFCLKMTSSCWTSDWLSKLLFQLVSLCPNQCILKVFEAHNFISTIIHCFAFDFVWKWQVHVEQVIDYPNRFSIYCHCVLSDVTWKYVMLKIASRLLFIVLPLILFENDKFMLNK